MVADTAADPGKGVFFFEKPQGLVVLTFSDQGDIALDAGMRRTGGLARGGTPFVYAECPRNGLGILFIDGLTKIDAFVVLVGKGDRADLGALAAACAFA